MQRALFHQFSCAFKALQAKEQVLMQKLTQAEVKQHQNMQPQHLTLMRISTPYIQQRVLRHQPRRLQNLILLHLVRRLLM